MWSDVDLHVRRWDVTTGATYEFSRSPDKKKAHRGMVKSIALLNGGARAITGAYWEGGTTKDYQGVAPPDQILRLWNVDTGAPLRSYPLNYGVRCCIQVLPDGHQVAILRATSWDENPVLEIVNLDDGVVARQFAPTSGESFHAMALHPGGRLFVIALGDAQFVMWDRITGQSVAQLVSADEGWAVFTPDGHADYSPGFAKWKCRNNIELACDGGVKVAPHEGLLAALLLRLKP